MTLSETDLVKLQRYFIALGLDQDHRHVVPGSGASRGLVPCAECGVPVEDLTGRKWRTPGSNSFEAVHFACLPELTLKQAKKLGAKAYPNWENICRAIPVTDTTPPPRHLSTAVKNATTWHCTTCQRRVEANSGWLVRDPVTHHKSVWHRACVPPPEKRSWWARLTVGRGNSPLLPADCDPERLSLRSRIVVSEAGRPGIWFPRWPSEIVMVLLFGEEMSALQKLAGQRQLSMSDCMRQLLKAEVARTKASEQTQNSATP